MSSRNITHDWLALKVAVIAGGSVGDHTVTGIRLGSQGRRSSNKGDQLLAVIQMPGDNDWLAEVDGDLDEINDYLHKEFERDGVIGGDFTIVAGAVATLTGAGHIRYRIGGQEYNAILDTTIDLQDSGDIANAKWAAWRILIDAKGVVTTLDPAGSGAQAFTSEEDAVMSLAQRALTAGTIEIGIFTLNTNSTFNIGTDNVNSEAAQTATVVRQPRLDNGLSIALGSTVVLVTAANTWSSGTINVKRNGVNLSEISAISTQAMDDADTIATLKFGAWVLVVDLAGTGVYALAADGIAGTVSAMSYDTAVLALAAINDVIDRLPTMLVPIAIIEVQNGSGGTFTAASTNWDATDITSTRTDETFGTFDRTEIAGIGRGINSPVVPSSVAAAVGIDAVDRTSEFSISADDTINNDGGTTTAGDKLLVIYVDDDK